MSKKILNNNFIYSILLFLLFIFLASILLNIPITEIDKQLPEHVDSRLIIWIWSWEAHTLPINPLNLFQANIFAPFNNTLAFTETMLGSFLLALPILLFFNNFILAYNLVVLFSFAVSGLGMYLLVYYLTKNKWAALLAALIYAFAPFKLIQSIGHLHLTGMWLPYVFLYLHKFFKYQSWKNISGLTFFIILVFLTGFHYFIFLPIVILVFTSVQVAIKKFRLNKYNIKKIILSLLILLLVIFPIIQPYFKLKEEYNFNRPIEAIEGYSADLIDYFVIPFFYDSFYFNLSHIEKNISPGLIIILLLIFALYYIFKRNKEKLLPMSEKIIFITYSIIATIAFFISFGFYIQFTSSEPGGMPGLYTLFYYFVPGFDSVRALGRYSVFILLGLSIFIGYGFNFWQQKTKDTFKKILVFFLITTLLLIELSFVPSVAYSTVNISDDDKQLYAWVKDQPDKKIFLELPMGFYEASLAVQAMQQNKNAILVYDIYYVFRSQYHFKKIVNGYSGYYPPGYLDLAEKLKIFNPDQDISHIKKFQVDYLIFHFDRYNNMDDKEKFKAATVEKNKQSDKIKYITNFGNNYIYEIIYD